MILKSISGTTTNVRSVTSSMNVTVIYGDKAGDVAIIIAMFVVLLILTTIGLLVAILRDEIENLYVTNILEPDED